MGGLEDGGAVQEGSEVDAIFCIIDTTCRRPWHMRSYKSRSYLAQSMLELQRPAAQPVLLLFSSAWPFAGEKRQTHLLIRSRSSSFSSPAPSHVCSNSISSALSSGPGLPVLCPGPGGGGGSILPSSPALPPRRPMPPPGVLVCGGWRAEGEAGVNGLAGEGLELDEVRDEGILGGMRGGMGRIHIRSRRRLCCRSATRHAPRRGRWTGQRNRVEGRRSV